MIAISIWLGLAVVAGIVVAASYGYRRRLRRARRDDVARKRARDAVAWQKILDKAALDDAARSGETSHPLPPSAPGIRPATADPRPSPWSER